MGIKRNRDWTILLCVTSAIATLSCVFPHQLLQGFGANPVGLSPESTPITDNNEENTSITTNHLTIEECNAIQDVSIAVEAMKEYTSDDGHIECDYAHRITNTGSQVIRILYYKHYFYGNEEPPNDYEFGWNKIAPLQPGESWSLNSSIMQCDNCTPPRYESICTSIAVVYDNPDCQWIFEEGGDINLDFHKITEDALLPAPCTLISPISY